MKMIIVKAQTLGNQFLLNRSNNYVGVIMELRQEIKNGVINN